MIEKINDKLSICIMLSLAKHTFNPWLPARNTI